MLGGTDVLFLLGADELDLAPASNAFIVYIGTHGDAGAHRADVILPAAAYTEKSGTYVNTEGRVQQTNRAGFAPGEAREDWAILRALSDVLGKKLPFDSLAQLRASLYAAHPHLARSTRSPPAAPTDVAKAAKIGGKVLKAAFASPVKDFYLTNPIARASAVMAECSASRRAASSRRRSKGRRWKRFFSLRAAGLDHPDQVGRAAGRPADLRCVSALCRPQDLGGGAASPRPERRRPVGPAAVLRRSAEVRRSRSRSSRLAPTRAFSCLRRWFRPRLRLATWAVIPVTEGWAIANINVGILYVFAISSLEVYGVIMGGWASNSKYPFLGALRSAAQMVSYEVSIGFVIITVLLCVGSLNLSDIVLSQQDGIGTMARPAEHLPRLALAGAVPDVHRVLHLGACRDEPAALRPGRSRIRNSSPAT